MLAEKKRRKREKGEEWENEYHFVTLAPGRRNKINRPRRQPGTAYIEQLTQEGVKSAPTAWLYTSLCGLVKVHHKEVF